MRDESVEVEVMRIVSSNQSAWSRWLEWRQEREQLARELQDGARESVLEIKCLHMCESTCWVGNAAC